MISLIRAAWQNELRIPVFVGLSTDGFPESGNSALINGARIYHMDTGKEYEYDEENDEWFETLTFVTALASAQGPKGDKGDPFSISKIYESIEAMEADFDNPDVAIDSFVIIESTEYTEDNGKLYIKNVTGFDYVTDLSTGTMIEGPQGNAGVGIPTGGTNGQILFKVGTEDYVCEWDTLDLSDYPTKDEIEDVLLPTITEEEDNGKIAQIVDGQWTAQILEHGEIIHAISSTVVLGYTVPTFAEGQITTIYNSYIAGKNVIISSADGKHHYHIISVDGADAENITVKVLYEDKIILTYNKFGTVSNYVPILNGDGQIVTLSREYGTAPNDHGFYREWSENPQGKVWVECGLNDYTAATMVGTLINLPVTFEDTNYHIQVTPADLGNFHVCALPIDESSINVRATDVNGGALAIKVYIEVKGWKAET